MKRGDMIWLAVLVSCIFYIISPWTNPAFIAQTTAHPYIGGFVKFAVLSTLGELLALRLKKGYWIKPVGLIWRIVIWGIIGILITLVFQLFARGVGSCLEAGYLPGGSSKLAFAFFTSALMNLFFAPVFMAIHKVSDTYLDLKYSGKKGNPTLDDVLKAADWTIFVKFVLIKTIPFFWIPAHTVTFLMPGEYRIVIAAFLSIALGAILSFAKKNKETVG